MHNGLISTHLETEKKKRNRKIHLEFAVNLCAYLPEVTFMV